MFPSQRIHLIPQHTVYINFIFSFPTPLYFYGIITGGIPDLLCAAALQLQKGWDWGQRMWILEGSQGQEKSAASALSVSPEKLLHTSSLRNTLPTTAFCLVLPKHTRTECEVLEGWGHIPIKQMLKRKKVPWAISWESKSISIHIFILFIKMHFISQWSKARAEKLSDCAQTW